MNNNSLEQSILQSQNLLTEFASSPDFLSAIETSFGSDFNLLILEQLRQQWLSSDFDNFPEIEIRSASEINEANGAFSIDTNNIYLAREFLNSSNSETVTSVLLEEYGHFVDSQINVDDALGDEGDIFSRIVRGGEISNSELQKLKSWLPDTSLWLGCSTLDFGNSLKPNSSVVTFSSFFGSKTRFRISIQ